jgi:hypothetical protein
VLDEMLTLTNLDAQTGSHVFSAVLRSYRDYLFSNLCILTTHAMFFTDSSGIKSGPI